MRSRLAVVLAVVLYVDGGMSSVLAQNALVGTWRLVTLERGVPGQPLAAVMNPIGILIQDAGGHVIEIVTRTGRGAPLSPQDQVVTYQAHWGTYNLDAKGSTITYRINGALDPGRSGQQIVRTFERSGPRLILTDSGPEAASTGRTTWEQIPALEALSSEQQAAIGFWEWVSAGMFTSAGVNVQPASRDASVIVYTPSGLMAVLYLPPPGRKRFAGAVPTADEARAALQGAVSYFGPYFVQPKSRAVFHYQIAAANPAAIGTSFTRDFEVIGAQMILRFPPTTLNGQQVRNTLTLKRLSGVAEMSADGQR
jgi:hypothetical protein